MESKQVIVIRKMDKGCRTGKYVAQCAHASLGAMLGLGQMSDDGSSIIIPLDNPFVKSWIVGQFKKVTCYVNTDAELIEIYNQAREAGIACSLIRDAGLTEFNGVSTLTAVGVGPDSEEAINKITGKLSLF